MPQGVERAGGGELGLLQKRTKVAECQVTVVEGSSFWSREYQTVLLVRRSCF
jgi:hypothetical protein